jgi:nitroimidazol reductase NimA-like FMN-containing flavoprotein (pyridoxamine 5'-phosphate oxidase superfamily)
MSTAEVTPSVRVARMNEVLKAKILDVLRRQHLMTIATIRSDGYPQATTVNYIHGDDFTLYFATGAVSQKAGNIALNDKVSVAIVDRAGDFYKLRGLSLSGTAARIHDKGRADEVALRLFRALPQSRRFVPEDPRSLAVYAVTPVAIALVDYATGFGTTHLLELWRASSATSAPIDCSREQNAGIGGRPKVASLTGKVII